MRVHVCICVCVPPCPCQLWGTRFSPCLIRRGLFPVTQSGWTHLYLLSSSVMCCALLHASYSHGVTFTRRDNFACTARDSPASEVDSCELVDRPSISARDSDFCFRHSSRPNLRLHHPLAWWILTTPSSRSDLLQGFMCVCTQVSGSVVSNWPLCEFCGRVYSDIWYIYFNSSIFETPDDG
jgi:hypothetical protein